LIALVAIESANAIVPRLGSYRLSDVMLKLAPMGVEQNVALVVRVAVGDVEGERPVVGREAVELEVAGPVMLVGEASAIGSNFRNEPMPRILLVARRATLRVEARNQVALARVLVPPCPSVGLWCWAADVP